MPEKKARDRLIRLAAAPAEWGLGSVDEVWWSRLAQPTCHSWTEGEPVRLPELTVEKSDPDPKARACDGLLRADPGQRGLRFVQGRPRSAITTPFLAWVCERVHAAGKKARRLVGDKAAWHLSHAVREWIRTHNRHAKRAGRVRIRRCQLPTQSPWLNRIEPHWMHGKRAIVEPTRTLTANELITRVCNYSGGEQCSPLSK